MHPYFADLMECDEDFNQKPTNLDKNVSLKDIDLSFQ